MARSNIPRWWVTFCGQNIVTNHQYGGNTQQAQQQIIFRLRGARANGAKIERIRRKQQWKIVAKDASKSGVLTLSFE